MNDWRSRACLENDQLELLFGNIQLVHALSKILLGEFKAAGTEPSKICQCFIKFRDEFNVYTYYW